MTRIRRQEISTGDSSLCLYRIASPVSRRGTILVPPLIGGGGLQQYGYYKDINRRGFELISFDYRGHGKSGGSFSVRRSIDDTLAVARAVREEHREPLLGMGNCYGAIPLLLAAEQIPDLFRAVALFNPIPDLRYAAGPREVFDDYFRPEGRWRLRNPLDVRGIVSATARRMFPGIDKSRDHFGILHYHRAHPLTVALECFLFRRTKNLRLPELASLVIYGRADATLRLTDPEREDAYRRRFARMLPRAQFRALSDVDHYWTSCYGLANEAALEFFTSLPGTRPERTIGSATPPARRAPALLAPR